METSLQNLLPVYLSSQTNCLYQIIIRLAPLIPSDLSLLHHPIPSMPNTHNHSATHAHALTTFKTLPKLIRSFPQYIPLDRPYPHPRREISTIRQRRRDTGTIHQRLLSLHFLLLTQP